ncbi:hypothetical protein ACFFQW_43755 [Umezawaea endophytica]|uniref:Uncharacterized protein n=1 Tax=Umezawaea endophytica TaxID=1654476 RepID=A0A9X2VUK9_9PSEU|nr:hypothetical protein [Umezawaea endophytica]MCS7483108.1 hypothetical protein [Umezawaea endophytica]
MAARFATNQVTADIDAAMTQLKDAMDQMPFAKHRFIGKFNKVTTAMGHLSVALEDVKPYLD